MDAKPFFEFDMLNAREQDVEELKKFTKSAFDLNGVLTTASELKYTREIKRIMGEQINNPSDDFVKLFAAQVLPGRMTQAVREQFTQATRRALKQFINDQVNERLKTALGGETRIIADAPPVAVKTTPVEVNNEEPPIQVQTVTTTAQELESFYIVKAILRESVDAKRIVMRDVQTYCGVLLDDNNRKPICRLYFNSVQHSLGLFGNADRKETRVPITSLDELYKYADRLKTTVGFYIK